MNTQIVVLVALPFGFSTIFGLVCMYACMYVICGFMYIYTHLPTYIHS